MSKERELLRKLFESGMLDRLSAIEVGQLLAQPETEQKPVAWMYEYAVRSSFDASFTGEWKEEMSRSEPDGTVEKFNPSKLESTIRNLTPLYAAQPKREPFGPEERQRLSKAYSTRAEQVAFEEGIIFAEISHGIGE